MTQDQIEAIYEAIAQGIDRTAEPAEIFLAKLCLVLARQIGDPALVEAEIARLAPPPEA
ncbi:MAG: hypothetical protein Kow0013_22380 [Pararhodobacter sp.]